MNESLSGDLQIQTTAQKSRALQRMDAEQQARDDAVAERQRKLEEAFKLGGGEALQQSMAEQSKAAIEKALREQDEQDHRDREKHRLEIKARWVHTGIWL